MPLPQVACLQGAHQDLTPAPQSPITAPSAGETQHFACPWCLLKVPVSWETSVEEGGLQPTVGAVKEAGFTPDCHSLHSAYSES
jgi:hypothetical protein